MDHRVEPGDDSDVGAAGATCDLVAVAAAPVAVRRFALANHTTVMPGLDPRVFAEGKARGIHRAGGTMDCRVKPGNDSGV